MATPQILDRQRSAQSTFTVTRLKQGDQLTLTLANLSGKPLYQTYDKGTAVFSPDWSGSANDAARPVICPQLASMLGASLVVKNPTWSFNGQAIPFRQASNPSEWAEENAATPRFAYRAQDMAIKPIANLADTGNPANGVLKFAAEVLANGGNYEISKDIDVILTSATDAAYRGFLTATNLSLDEQNTETDITATLFSKGVEVTSFHTKWYRDRDHLTGKDGQKTLHVTRSQVDSMQLYTVEFYLSAADAHPVAVAGVTVVDSADGYYVVIEAISANTVISDSHPSVTLQAHLVSRKTGAFMTTNVAWMMDVVDPETFKSIKSSNTDTIVVTTAETDRVRTVNGRQRLVCSDVDVIAEAHWGLNFSVSKDQLAIAEPYYRNASYVKGEALTT